MTPHPSPRIHCPHFTQGRCCSCRRIETPYVQQLTARQAELQRILSAIPTAAWLPPQASPQTAFRNKAKMAVLGAAHAPVLGITDPTGQAVDLSDCLLYPPDMQAVLTALPAWIRQAGIPPYRIDRAKGELKFILLTRSQDKGEFLLRFVLRSEAALARIHTALPALLAAFPAIQVVSANIQPIHMAVLEGEQEIFLTPKQHLEEHLNGLPLFIRPKSFFQTNPQVAARLYRCARDWGRESRPRQVWDLFCGTGAFGLHLAGPDTGLTGIEIEPEAIACARESARRLGLENVRFAALDAAGFAGLKAPAPDLLVVNPPRRGLGIELCRQLAQLHPPVMLYSSCNPHTLARDLAQLPDYRVVRARLFDMFPHTTHCEVLVQLAAARMADG
ncbi:MAG: 23S rRNA (uracil(747)-C(5))-methyltransferase RlmC [Thiothrix sp.]|nr:23S rRNA (uracil(747)-C(5))-methyltransferase RlmC [Thiothrix sp.]HPQ96789.1 23S rRNA (uracil(747)-C(5))-methyltransferase RlmC [Thiolinea sp.]